MSTLPADPARVLQDNLEYIHSIEANLKKTLRVVPSGRPRILTKKEVEPSAHSDYDDDLDTIDLESTLKELRAELDVRRREEDKLQKEIADILAESNNVSGEQSRSFGLAVTRLNNSMLVAETDAKQLAASLRTISRLADSISGKVSALDIAKTRVVECLQLAGDMRDLGICSEGVDEAIRQEDYEQAAQHIHRFLTLDKAVFQLRDNAAAAEKDPEAGQSVRHSYEVLTSAAARLKEIAERRLDDAIASGDVSAMQRFFKIFPLLNEHDSGLSRYAKYLGGQIEKLGHDHIKVMLAGGTEDARAHVLYADTLYLFLEGVAAVLESNQPLVQSSYGPDKLLDFITILQMDVDAVVGKIIESFSKKRRLDIRARTARRMLRTNDRTNEKSDSNEVLELDVILQEMCMMNDGAERYWRFVKRRIGDNTNNKGQQEYIMVNDVDEFDMDEETKKKAAAEMERRRVEREKKLDQLLNRSVLGTKLQELLGQYILLEQFYIEESVQKAIDMDAREDSGEEKAELRSSVAFDVMFLIRKCVLRASKSGSIDCICATLNNGVAILETTYHNYLQNMITAGYPSAGFAAEAFQTAQTAYNVIQHGKTVAESGPDAQREAFLTALNNARGTPDLINDMKKHFHAAWGQITRSDVEKGKLETAITQLDEAARKMLLLSSKGIDSLCHTAFRPKLKTSCEAYLDQSHCLSESQFADNEAVDPFIENFNAVLDKQIAYFSNLLLEENYKALLLSVCSEVCVQMERVILKCSWNRLGGLQLDREFRQLTTYLSGVAGWTARERCSRLAQIVSLLNVDSVEEAGELWEQSRASSIARALDAADARRVLLLRTDLPSALVNQMRM